MTFEAYKKRLGATADTMTDEEIEKLFMLQSRLADLIIEKWFREKAQVQKDSMPLSHSDNNGIISPHV